MIRWKNTEQMLTLCFVMSPFSIVIIPCPIVNEVGFIPTIRPKFLSEKNLLKNPPKVSVVVA
jgi:hypothetical protein